MTLFACRSCDLLEKQVQSLLARCHDLQEAYITLQQSFAKEREQLLDRILVVQNPAAAATMRRINVSPEGLRALAGQRPQVSYPTEPPAPRPPNNPQPGRLLRRRESGDGQMSLEDAAKDIITGDSG